MNLTDQLNDLLGSPGFILPEIILACGICGIVILGLIFRNNAVGLLRPAAILICLISLALLLITWPTHPMPLFLGMIRADDFSCYLRILADTGGVVVLLMTRPGQLQKPAEYCFLLITAILGAHLLVMSTNFIMVVLSLELMSLSSYALAGWAFSKTGVEASLKYFLFGSVATAIMIYGISWIAGLAGTLDFSSEKFVRQLMEVQSPLLQIGGILTLAGFLFKIGAAPMHFWTPDVYEAAPMPVVAFFSVVPKLAGLGALTKFVLAISLFGQGHTDWQLLLAGLALLSVTVGNFSALGQNNPKRLMAYSSIAQAGFLLIGVTTMSLPGAHAMLFYGTILLLMNLLTFLILQQFEAEGVTTMEAFSGRGRGGSFRSIALTIGLIALVGLPITAGFTAKLFIFSGLWESYATSHKTILLVLLSFGLLNTVVSLFYYLRIPYYLFLKERATVAPPAPNPPFVETALSLVLVILIVLIFFQPDLLMGWIIKVNFVL